MSFYADYYKERLGCETLETERGFCVYKVTNQECFIQEIYVHPDWRMQGEMVGLLARVQNKTQKEGCTYMSDTVVPRAAGCTEALFAAIKAGFKIVSSSSTCILVVKDF